MGAPLGVLSKSFVKKIFELQVGKMGKLLRLTFCIVFAIACDSDNKFELTQIVISIFDQMKDWKTFDSIIVGKNNDFFDHFIQA